MRKYVIRREVPSKKEGGKANSKAPKIQRLVTPVRLQRKRALIAAKRHVRSHLPPRSASLQQHLRVVSCFAALGGQQAGRGRVQEAPRFAPQGGPRQARCSPQEAPPFVQVSVGGLNITVHSSRKPRYSFELRAYSPCFSGGSVLDGSAGHHVVRGMVDATSRKQRLKISSHGL